MGTNLGRRSFLSRSLKLLGSLAVANEAVYLVGSFSSSLDGSVVANAKSWAEVQTTWVPITSPLLTPGCYGPCNPSTAGNLCYQYAGFSSSPMVMQRTFKCQ